MSKESDKNENKDKQSNPITGVISVTGRGIGYISAEGLEEDIEIQLESLHTALHHDIVEVRILAKGEVKKDPRHHFKGKKEDRIQGEVVRVVERARMDFVGLLELKDGEYVLTPDDKRMYTDISVPKEEAKSIEENTKVLVHIKEWSDPKVKPVGTIIRVIGKKGVHETEMVAIVLEHNFDLAFHPEIEKEAEEIGKKRTISEEEISKRKDIRGVTTFTIDPDDAKDFDDALSIQTLSNGNTEVGIHIADVTHYVRPETAIDTEARERGTSIYLVDRTIPMLPEVLSNDVCSLNPNEDKLTFSAIFELDSEAKVQSRWFGRTIINSDKRFTYQTAQDSLDLPEAESAKEGVFSKELKTLDALSLKLRAQRFKDGSIAFERDEVKFKLDEHGKPLGVFVKERLETMMMIEDFMLLANREVAEYLYTLCKDRGIRDTVLIYRVHDVPDPDKIEQLSIFLKAIGYDLEVDKDGITSKEINRLLKEIKGTPEETLIQTATIRSMAKAIYSTKNIGHFSLSFKFYTHFTSPIRRYPDMMVHRILASHLDRSPIPEKELQEYARLTMASSAREAEASGAERDSIKYKQVEYMKDHIGEVFDGTVTGVADFGLFVEENETRAEGMIRLRDLGDDYYTHERGKYSIVGEKTKKAFQLGDPMRVKLIEADLDSKTLTWVPA